MTPEATLHATSVSIDRKGVLILGPSGAGKSSLALQLIALGAQLIADDRTTVTKTSEHLVADVPLSIAGLIEARGVGLIRTPPAGPTRLSLIVDLAQSETARLPEPHSHSIHDITLPCLWASETPHFAASILLYLKGGIGGIA